MTERRRHRVDVLGHRGREVWVLVDGVAAEGHCSVQLPPDGAVGTDSPMIPNRIFRALTDENGGE